MSAAAGLTDAHRRVYDLLVNKHHESGLDRDALRMMAGLDDRALRKVIEDLRPVAALNPHPRYGAVVLGFDPQREVYCAATSSDMADRLLRYQMSRVEALLGPLLVQVDAARASFGDTHEQLVVQERLLDAKPLLRGLR